MHIYQIRGEDLAQFTVRVTMSTAKVLEQMKKEGRHKSVNRLIESILNEIALDETEQRSRRRLDESKSSKANVPSVVASAIK